MHRNNLLDVAFKADVLEDAVKLAANKGDELAIVIMAAVPQPDVEHLAAWFQERAKAQHPARSTSRNRKKPPTAKKVAAAAS